MSFIVDNEEIRIDVAQETEYEACSEQITEVYLEVENINPTIPCQQMYRKTEAVQRKCYSDRKYVPLKVILARLHKKSYNFLAILP